MASSNHLQPMPIFEPKSDPTNTSTHWTQWLERFNTYLVAANIKDEPQKRAILLYQADPEVYEIFKMLLNTGEAKDFKKAVDALTAYFEPDKNKIYQTYMFRQAKQMPSETVDQYHTRLRGLAKYCDFHDTDFEIKMQVVCNGTSSRLRKRALRDADYSFKDMLVDGRKAEISTAQASAIEEQFKELQVNEIKTSSRKCYYCGMVNNKIDEGFGNLSFVGGFCWSAYRISARIIQSIRTSFLVNNFKVKWLSLIIQCSILARGFDLGLLKIDSKAL